MAARIIMYPEKRKSDPNRSARRPDTCAGRMGQVRSVSSPAPKYVYTCFYTIISFV